MSKNIDRIQADNDLRLLNLNLVVASAGGESSKEIIDTYRNSLIEQRGEIVQEAQIISETSEILAFTQM